MSSIGKAGALKASLADELKGLNEDVLGGMVGGLLGGAPGATMSGVRNIRENWGTKEAALPKVEAPLDNRVAADGLNGTEPAVEAYKLRSASEKIKEFYNSVMGMKDRTLVTKRKTNIGTVSEKNAGVIRNILSEADMNIDTTGWNIDIDGSAIEHINRRHGSSGEADHSMSSVEDVGLIPYVIESASEGTIARNEDGSLDLNYQFRNCRRHAICNCGS